MVEKTDQGHFWPNLMDPLRNLRAQVGEWLAPASDASGGKSGYRISMELPGVSEDAVDVSVENGVLNISGEKKTETERSGDTWFFSERQYGAFRRSFRLPEDADEDAVDAVMKDGVLSITVGRRAPSRSDAKKIAIGRG
jgi:HSP20 family protein